MNTKNNVEFRVTGSKFCEQYQCSVWAGVSAIVPCPCGPTWGSDAPRKMTWNPQCWSNLHYYLIKKGEMGGPLEQTVFFFFSCSRIAASLCDLWGLCLCRFFFTKKKIIITPSVLLMETVSSKGGRIQHASHLWLWAESSSIPSRSTSPPLLTNTREQPVTYYGHGMVSWSLW